MERVRFRCPSCGATGKAKAELRGQWVKCPRCDMQFGLEEFENESATIQEISPWDKLDSSPPAPEPKSESSASAGFRCPYCQSILPPIRKPKASPLSCLLLVILGLLCFPVAIVILFMLPTQYEYVCASCKVRIS